MVGGKGRSIFEGVELAAADMEVVFALGER